MLLGLRGPVRAFADGGHIAVDSQASNQKIFNERFVILKGERMRWGNLDSVEHTLVPDTPSLPEFETTGPLAPGDERSFVMMTTGTTRIHCTEHPQMIGTLVVRERWSVEGLRHRDRGEAIRRGRDRATKTRAE